MLIIKQHWLVLYKHKRYLHLRITVDCYGCDFSSFTCQVPNWTAVFITNSWAQFDWRFIRFSNTISSLVAVHASPKKRHGQDKTTGTEKRSDLKKTPGVPASDEWWARRRGVENKLRNVTLSACIRWMRDMIRGFPEWTHFTWCVVVGEA